MAEGEPISIVIQKPTKESRLAGRTLDLLRGCDLMFTAIERVDVAQATDQAGDLKVEIISSKNKDIPKSLLEDDIDLGIVGYDVFRESELPAIEIMRLGFAPCKMVLGVRRDFTYAGPASLEGKIVATSYPNIARKFFADHNVQVDLRTRDGSVEAIARRNKASAVVDARDSGESLRTNDLKEQEVIFESDAVLVANPALRQQMEKRKDIEGLLKRIISYLRPEFFRWITMNTSSEHEQDIKHILFDYCPSPTVSVCNIDMLDIAAVIPTYNFWKTVDDLQAKGAFKVDQLKIERSIPDLTDPQLRGAIGNLYG